MIPERWQEVKAMIKERFSVEYEGQESLPDQPGTVDVVEFVGPAGPMRAEYVTKPKQVGRKVHTSTRIGGRSHEELLYSSSESVQYLQLYTWSDADEEWKEMDQSLLSKL